MVIITVSALDRVCEVCSIYGDVDDFRAEQSVSGL